MKFQLSIHSLTFICSLHKHVGLFFVGPLIDTLGSLSSIMFSSVCAWLQSQAAGVPFCPIHKGRRSIQKSYLSLSISELGVFSLKVKLKRYARKESACAIQNTFSIRQEIYCRLSIVRCWQIPHIFHIRPLETWGCFKTQGTSSRKTV